MKSSRQSDPALNTSKPAFVVLANGTPTTFCIDDEAFACWTAVEGDESVRGHIGSSDDSPGSALSDLVYRALSAGVLVGDPGIELNIHSHTDGTGYFLRLNNVAGAQRMIGLTRGRHEALRPLNDLPLSEHARRYLQEICDVANTLLDSLPSAPT